MIFVVYFIPMSFISLAVSISGQKRDLAFTLSFVYNVSMVVLSDATLECRDKRECRLICST